jgi:hypothetical protein
VVEGWCAMKFTPAQCEQYYRLRLDSYGLRHSRGMEFRSRCPFHGGSNPSALWVRLDEGNFNCFACGVKGGSIFSFEQEMLKLEGATSQAPEVRLVQESIEKILGTPFIQRVYPEPVTSARQSGWDRTKAQDFYRYTDEVGAESFTVWRFVDRQGNKKTPPDHPCPCRSNPGTECESGCENGRVWGSKGCRRVLYRWPDVIQAGLVFIVEGEKNVNDLSRALAQYIAKKGGFPLGNLTLDRVGVTTNPGGSSGWKPEYGFGKEFQSKVVIKLGDNDVPGRTHDAAVCGDVAKYASKLFTLDLPVGEGEDISNYLEGHSIEDFLKLLANRKEWATQKAVTTELPQSLAPRVLLVPPSHLVAGGVDGSTDWLVRGLIERGTRGLMAAPPKAGKSLLFLDLVICMALRDSFLGAPKYHREVKTAVISREDGPGLVHRRLSQLAAGRGLSAKALDSNLLVNTERQSSTFRIDVQRDLDEMAEWLRAGEVEFTVIDVLNRIHSQQENSSDDMTRVMQRFDELAEKSGSQICVIHHTSKSGGIKGSTSIEAWADYVCRLEPDVGDESIKKLLLKTKSISAVEPRFMRYWQSPDESRSQIKLLERVS